MTSSACCDAGGFPAAIDRSRSSARVTASAAPLAAGAAPSAAAPLLPALPTLKQPLALGCCVKKSARLGTMACLPLLPPTLLLPLPGRRPEEEPLREGGSNPSGPPQPPTVSTLCPPSCASAPPSTCSWAMRSFRGSLCTGAPGAAAAGSVPTAGRVRSSRKAAANASFSSASLACAGQTAARACMSAGCTAWRAGAGWAWPAGCSTLAAAARSAWLSVPVAAAMLSSCGMSRHSTHALSWPVGEVSEGAW
mmetsp:Transcript_7791/g.19360  ORF Transcript_7791/g.19360 Transcript_7791/m.19360 type:complete len:251 (-) Transcript_7791:530-1282(-)